MQKREWSDAVETDGDAMRGEARQWTSGRVDEWVTVERSRDRAEMIWLGQRRSTRVEEMRRGNAVSQGRVSGLSRTGTWRVRPCVAIPDSEI